MMLSRLFPVTLITAALFFLSSCNGSEETANTKKSSRDSATSEAASKQIVASTIVYTPQSILLVKHKVTNFIKWKASYDAHDSLRLAAGMHNYVIGRSVADSNLVMVALKADDMAKAKAFAADPKLKEAMQKGGVAGKPTFTFFTATFQDTVLINTPMRSLTTFPIKDWEAWQKAFTEGRQERIENGITDRVYGHDADDNNKIMLVTALIDTAKAFTYMKSDMLKKRRAASGAIGEPDRFVFNIVQRY